MLTIYFIPYANALYSASPDVMATGVGTKLPPPTQHPYLYTSQHIHRCAESNVQGLIRHIHIHIYMHEDYNIMSQE